VELGVRAVNVARATQDYVQYYDPRTQLVYDAQIRTTKLDNANYVQPTLAMVFDNSISAWVGPAMGRRWRFEYAPAIGDWQFHEFVADHRRYDVLFTPVTLATRATFFGRFGRDTDQFRYFLGFPDFLRGYTAGSFRRHECLSDRPGEIVVCDDLNQLIGQRLAVVSAELRFPLIQSLNLSVLPIGFPPIEGAVFFDMGMAWNGGNRVVWKRAAGESKTDVRQPLKAWGVSVRANMGGFLILRVEWAKPLDRGDFKPFWTLSIGPTF
jgi:outer membrane protein assembly factor BamA